MLVTQAFLHGRAISSIGGKQCLPWFLTILKWLPKMSVLEDTAPRGGTQTNPEGSVSIMLPRGQSCGSEIPVGT